MLKQRPIGFTPQINFGHPLSSAVVFLAVPWGDRLFDIVSQTYGTLAGTVPTPSTTEQGESFNFTGAGTSTWAGLVTGIGNDGALTLFVRSKYDGSPGAFQTPISIDNDLGIYAPNISSTDNFASDSLGFSTSTFATDVVLTNEFQDFGISFDDGVAVSHGYINGAHVGDGTNNYNLGTASRIDIGTGQTTEFYNGDVAIGIVAKESLNASEHRLLSQDPYALIQQYKTPIWMLASTAVITSIPIFVNHFKNQGIM